MLLYVFLKRRYRHVEIVFVRHTHEAKEVDEETFFNSPETGGTLVSSALVEMKRIVAEQLLPQQAGTSTRRKPPTATIRPLTARPARLSCATPFCRFASTSRILKWEQMTKVNG